MCNKITILILSFLISSLASGSPESPGCNIEKTVKTPTSSEALSTGLSLLNSKFKGMLTKERCDIFQRSLDNVKNGLHLLPSEALFDSMAYFHKHKGKSPLSKHGKDLLEKSKEAVSIAYQCKKRKKKKGSIKWTRGDGKKVSKSCSHYIKGLGFHQNLIRDHESKINNPFISIGNFDINSDLKRFFIIDSRTGEVNVSTKVAHGRGFKSGKNRNLKLTKCKTRSGDTKDQTRPGFYKVTSRVLKQAKVRKAKYAGSYLTKSWPIACHDGVYNPKARRSKKCGKGKPSKFFNALRIVGLQDSNSDAYESGVIMHGASYVPPSPEGWGVSGASQGCPAFSYKDFEKIGQGLTASDSAKTSLYYSYAPICGGVKRDPGKRVKRIAKFKKGLADDHKTISKGLKKLLSSTYLKSFNKQLKESGKFYEHFSAINPKFAKAWGKKLKRKPLSTLEYLLELERFIESKESKSPAEIVALDFIQIRLSPSKLKDKNDESLYINEYISACKRLN